MTKIEQLRQLVKDAYCQELASADDWAVWLYRGHVLVVAQYAVELAQKYDANVEFAEAAALLHDLADFKMKRADPSHEEESLRLAREFMEQVGYSEEEIALIVDDAIKFHSCRGDERPQSNEGLALATADALAHLKTNFYIVTAWLFGNSDRSLEIYKEWALKKLEKDFYNKISFEEERQNVRAEYEKLKDLIGKI